MYKPPKRRKLTKTQRQAVYEKYQGHCAYCGTPIDMRAMQADHVIPMELYETYKAIGQDIDTLDNMLPACRSCNNYKHSLTLEKFRAAIERWPEVLMRDSVTYKNAVRYGLVIPNPKLVKFYFERIGMHNEALEKQMPKEPTMRTTDFYDGTLEGECPECGQAVDNDQNCCHKCGQALKWEDMK